MIFTNGCSYTNGKDNWPNGFGNYGYKFYNELDPMEEYDIINSGAGGAGNTVIRRKTFHALNGAKYKGDVDYAIIQWSTIDRWDYPIFVSEDRADDFPRMNMHPERINKINYMHNGTRTDGYGKEFYEKYYSVHGAVIDTLENIYHTQLYLKEMNIPYKMITIGNLFQMDVAIDNLINLQKRKDNRSGDYSTLKTTNILERLEEMEESFLEINIINELLEKIDFSNFLFTDDNIIGGFGGGIIEWMNNNNESMAEYGFHPNLRQSTKFFDEFLWPKIKDEVETHYTKINN
jgi:hypothetical protein